MNKKELIEGMVKRANITESAAKTALDSLLFDIEKALRKGDKVSLVGFGTFQVQKRKARQGINPQTGQKISIPAKEVPKFKPGRSLREAVT